MTYYDILEISPTASEEVIKMAYSPLIGRRFLKLWADLPARLRDL